eukprot:6831480-Pyramimonas_sp.AAC.1
MNFKSPLQGVKVGPSRYRRDGRGCHRVEACRQDCGSTRDVLCDGHPSRRSHRKNRAYGFQAHLPQLRTEAPFCPGENANRHASC